MAGCPRSRAALGDAGNHDGHDSWSIPQPIGETAPLLMVGAAGSILRLPKGPLDRYSALPVEIYNYAKEPDTRFQTVAAGGILILVVLYCCHEFDRDHDSQPLQALSLGRFTHDPRERGSGRETLPSSRDH